MNPARSPSIHTPTPGDVLASDNTVQAYNGENRAPTYLAAFIKGAGSAMASTVAANCSGNDLQIWRVVN